MESPAQVADIEERGRKIAQALSLVMAGDTAAGMALYDEWVRGDFVADLPIAVHLCSWNGRVAAPSAKR